MMFDLSTGDRIIDLSNSLGTFMGMKGEMFKIKWDGLTRIDIYDFEDCVFFGIRKLTKPERALR